jgi:hypothetical protein
MAEIRYGWREGSGKGKEYPMADAQYIARRGGKFVYLNAVGNATLCTSGSTKVFGWVETEKDDPGKNAWKSSTGDKEFIMYDLDAVFEMPALQTSASLAASWCGKGAAIETTGATYDMVQGARVGGGVASPLSVVDVDTTNNTVFVKVKSTNKQAN